MCPRQYMSAYDGQECVYIPLPYRIKKADFGFAVDAAVNPLSFDVASTTDYTSFCHTRTR